ncbi:MAG: hypothetical protein ABIH89_00415 [Elusimicrobiota bacterium]
MKTLLKTRGFVIICIIALVYWGYFYFLRSPKALESRVMERSGRAQRDSENRQHITHELNRNILETAISIYKEHEGAFPGKLADLVEKKYLDTMPDPGDRDWVYDPETGTVI